MNRYWFKPKRYGFGAVPVSWEGWAATAVLLLAILSEMQFIPPRFLDAEAGQLISLLAQCATTAAFLLLCRLKTEGAWRWRWGESA
jgi:hypothetical protein